MTDYKKSRVSNERLSDMVLEYGMGVDSILRVGKAQVKDGLKDVQVKMRADCFEALLAAVYLTRGMDEASRIVYEVEGMGDNCSS